MAGDIRYDVGVSVDNALKNLSTLSNRIQKVGEDFDGLATTARNAAAVLTAALGGLITSAASFADQMADVAAANETSIASVLGLASALQGAGGNADSVGRLMQTLSNNIDGANGGNLKMVETFGKLGISIENLGSMANDQIRNNLIKALADIKDPAERAAKAQEIFGKAAMGVDFKALARDIDEQSAKYQQYEANIKLASDAFGAMESIIKDLKIAATIAFEPLFKYVKDLKPGIDGLVVVIRLLAAALGLAIGASVLAGFAKLITLVKTLTVVARANPLIAIASAVLGVATAVGVWDNATTSVEESQAGVNAETEKTAEKVGKVKRDQSGIYDAIKKQKDTLTQVGEQFDRQLQNIKDKVKFEGQALTLNEDQKKIVEQTAAIEQATQNALLSLKQKFESLDGPARKARQADYEKERAQIEANGAAAIRNITDNISKTQQYSRTLKDLQAAASAFNDIQIQYFEILAKRDSDLAGLQERIELESKLAAITRLRTSLMSTLANVSEEEKSKVVEVITLATTQGELLKKSYQEINDEIIAHISLMGEQGVISKQTADQIIANTNRQRSVIVETSKNLQETNQFIANQSRTFDAGWKKAFDDYVDNASNAATAAQNIFRKATQGMEDALVNFVKTGKFEFKGFVASMLEELLRSQLRSVMAQLFTMNKGGMGAGGSFLGSLLGFANGGMVPTNQPVIVGERGPEILSGVGGRTVIPNESLGGMNYVTYNINAVDARSFKEMLAQDPSYLYALTQQGGKAIPGRR